MEDFVFLSVPQIQRIHDQQIQLHGGEDGMLNEGALEAAAAAPIMTAVLFEGSLEERLHQAAATYMRSLSQDHPFVDGNKRTAAMSTVVFYRMNGGVLAMDEDDLVTFAERVVTERITRQGIAAFLQPLVTLGVPVDAQ